MADLFAEHDSDALRGFVIWLPMIITDRAGAAGDRARESADPRIAQSWDPERSAGDAVQKTLDLSCRAWDVYLVYEPGILWTEEVPPYPTSWSHQLWLEMDAHRDRALDPERLSRDVGRLLDGVHALGLP